MNITEIYYLLGLPEKYRDSTVDVYDDAFGLNARNCNAIQKIELSF